MGILIIGWRTQTEPRGIQEYVCFSSCSTLLLVAKSRCRLKRQFNKHKRMYHTPLKHSTDSVGIDAGRDGRGCPNAGVSKTFKGAEHCGASPACVANLPHGRSLRISEFLLLWTWSRTLCSNQWRAPCWRHFWFTFICGTFGCFKVRRGVGWDWTRKRGLVRIFSFPRSREVLTLLIVVR